jgi:hypothetical protein
MTDSPLQEDGPRPARSPFSPTNDRDRKVVPFRERLSCTVDEACVVTGLGRTKLYELIGSGQLNHDNNRPSAPGDSAIAS